MIPIVQAFRKSQPWEWQAHPVIPTSLRPVPALKRSAHRGGPAKRQRIDVQSNQEK